MVVLALGSAGVLLFISVWWYGTISFQRTLSRLPLPALLVLVVVSGLFLTSALLHSLRASAGGRLRIDIVRSELTYDPWSPKVHLGANVLVHNRDRTMGLRPVSVEMVDYQLDGQQHEGRLAGRIIATSATAGLIDPRQSRASDVIFELDAYKEPAVIRAKVLVTDQFGQRCSARLQFGTR